MKWIGVALIACGIALICYVGFLVVRERTALKTPIPEDSSVKVIFITPAP